MNTETHKIPAPRLTVADRLMEEVRRAYNFCISELFSNLINSFAAGATKNRMLQLVIKGPAV